MVDTVAGSLLPVARTLLALTSTDVVVCPKVSTEVLEMLGANSAPEVTLAVNGAVLEAEMACPVV